MQHQDTVAIDTPVGDPRVDTQGLLDVGTIHRTVDRTVIFDFDGTIADS